MDEFAEAAAGLDASVGGRWEEIVGAGEPDEEGEQREASQASRPNKTVTQGHEAEENFERCKDEGSRHRQRSQGGGEIGAGIVKYFEVESLDVERFHDAREDEDAAQQKGEGAVAVHRVVRL